jgi:Protein of unknown function (DUF2000)
MPRSDRASRADTRGVAQARDTACTELTPSEPGGGGRVPGADLEFVGIAVHGPKNAVDKVVRGARMHP